MYIGKLQVFVSKKFTKSSSEGHMLLQFCFDFLLFWQKDIYKFCVFTVGIVQVVFWVLTLVMHVVITILKEYAACISSET